MSAVIGQVSQQTGTFVRIGTDGKEQLLHAGDKIHKGDKVIAKEGEALTVTLSNDEVIKLDKNSPVTFDASIIGDELFTKEDVSSEELTLDQVLEGASIDADAVGETAAGQGNQSYVSGATTIDRIGESGDAKAQTSSSEFEASSQSTKPQANALSFVDSVENAQALNGANEQNPEVPNSEDPTTSINIEGSNSDDTLLGTADDDTILGNQGNDTIIAGEGNDTISGGEGSDIINAGSGNDTIAGDAGDDLIQGGAGNDLIEGGTGADTISGDLGDDILLGGSGSDTISGGDGNDTIQGGDDNDTLIGGDGQDILLGEAGDDTISGNNGDDTLNGGTGADIL
ncbi:MAG: hypothetical protein OEW60_05660, partial [Thiovulaceae bacterium]|nr:hypothetical protein [Sulfurimonadaceae bacterium]